MSDFKTIIHTNPHLFVEDFVEAVKERFYLENSNRGWVSDGVYKEISLYKNPDKVFEKKEIGEFIISDYNAQNFLYELCAWVSQGAHIDIDSLFWDITGIKSVKGKLYLPAEYTKEQLSAMEWTEFKDAVRSVAGTGRDRALLTTRYLTQTGQVQ